MQPGMYTAFSVLGHQTGGGGSMERNSFVLNLIDLKFLYLYISLSVPFPLIINANCQNLNIPITKALSYIEKHQTLSTQNQIHIFNYRK